MRTPVTDILDLPHAVPLYSATCPRGNRFANLEGRMLRCVRFTLVVVATVSAVLLCTPASAGMVATPAGPSDDQAERKMAIESLKARLADSGVDPAKCEAKLEKLETADLVQLSLHAEASRHAGSAAVAIAISVAVVGALLLVILETYYP